MQKYPNSLPVKFRCIRYSDLLAELATDKPKTASLLLNAQEHREKTLQRYLNGARIRGFEELLEHLEAVHSVYSNHAELSKVAFLLKRSKGEFITALEALLSGFHAVAHDAMRAVMEIEFLLRDFSLDVTRMEEWLTADLKTLNDRFRPAILRQRFANHVGTPVNDLPEAMDYKAHSMVLHVGRWQNPFGVSGLADDSEAFVADFCFWEIFEHARRLLTSVHGLVDTVQSGILEDYNPENLEKFRDAWVRTQEMQQIWLQLIRSATEKTSNESDA